MNSSIVDEVERNIMEIFGDEEVATYQSARRRTASASSVASVDTDFSNSVDSDGTSGDSSSEESEGASGGGGETGDGDEWVDEPVTPIPLPLLGQPGIQIPNTATMSAIDYFKVFFNLEFLGNLALSTNAHAGEILSRGFSRESRLKRWKATDAEELLTFLGILFFMGTVRLNKLNDYWAKSHLVKFEIGKYMSRNRFLLIFRMLYFQPNGVGGSLYSLVDPLINYFNSLMKNIVYPQKELTIDESMVLFRGRLIIRQFIKNKRHKFGVKLYILADPNGLVHRIHIYKGSADSELSGKGHVNKVVHKLIEDYLYAGHSLYMDNYYNSVDLAEILLSKKTYVTGTLLTNRKRNPIVVTNTKLRKGGHIYRNNRKGVCVMKWKDKRDVLTLSTEHTPEMVDVVNRRGRTVTKPNMVVKYNKFMKGVDRCDQMLAYYPCEHKSMRWYKKIGVHIFQIMLINAYFLYQRGTGNNIPLESFREKVIHNLLPPLASRTLPPQLPSHMPEELPRNGDGVLKRRKCARCWSKHKKRKDSGLFCPDCNIGLCLTCYSPYHMENMLLS